MTLTTNQVAEKLNVSRDVVKRMVRDGLIKPINKRGEGAKKFFMKFDSKDINEYLKNNKSPKTFRVKINNDSPVEGFNSKLDRIESKIDKLIKIWS